MITKLKTGRQAIGFLFLILFGFFASGVSLKMDFTSQAPEGNWSEPWYNDCEEASIAMVDSFYNNRSLTSAIAKKEILRILDVKEKVFGPSLSEDAEKIVDLVNNFLNSNWKARFVENPTIEHIKDEINNNNPVILPTDGRKLNNRYYTTSHYHVFVISGYDDDKKIFITQDPGTYRGKNYQYSYAVIENAMHDYNPDDLSKGRRAAIFTGLEIKDSENNGEGENELKKIDSASGDFAKDEEIKKNNLPAVSEKNTKNSDFIKIIGDYWVYLTEWIKKAYYNYNN